MIGVKKNYKIYICPNNKLVNNKLCWLRVESSGMEGKVSVAIGDLNEIK